MKPRFKLLLDFYVGGLLHAILKIPTILLGKFLGRNHDLMQCSEIAVMKFLGGGSLVIAYPTLLALKQLPQVRKLTLVTTPSVQPFGKTLSIFDEIIVIREDSVLHLGTDSLSALIRLFRHDCIIDFEVHSRLTTVFSLFTCARNRVGFFTNISFWRLGISTHLLFCNVSNGIYYFYDQITALFGTAPVTVEQCTAHFREQINAHPVGGSEIHLAIAPTCSSLSRERMLELEEWLEIVAQRLERFPMEPVLLHLFGAPSDRLFLEDLKALLIGRFGNHLRVFNYAGKTKLAESVKLLSGMSEVLCIDSALLHFSRLLGLRTVSYWGPTDPRILVRPRAGDLDEIHYVKIPCSPCVHVSDQPPCRGNNICMRLAANPSVPVSANPSWVLR